MSVLIKGMDMPKSCAACKFRWSDSESVDPFTDYCFLTNARLGYYDNKRAKWKKERRKDCPLVEVNDDAVSPCEVCPLVKEMNENVDELVGELYGEDGSLKQRYCDRNICMTNEYNGIECGECEVTKHNERIKKCESCYIAQNYNLEDDDSPCQNCGVEE